MISLNSLLGILLCGALSQAHNQSDRVKPPIPPGAVPPGVFPGGGGGGTSSDPIPSPLDPLTENEIRTTSNVIKSDSRWKSEMMFSGITLKEPLKSEILEYFLNDSVEPDNTISRRSFTGLVELSGQKMFEVIVNLDTKQVESWKQVSESARPAIPPDLERLFDDIVKQDAGVQRRCREVGFPNMSLVFTGTWPSGYIGDVPEYRGKWIYQTYLYGQHSEWDNEFAHPFDFLAMVDISKQKVVSILDLPTHDDFDAKNKTGNTIPQKEDNYDPGLINPNYYRKDLKPVKVSQNGTSFTLVGYELKWQKFKMRIGFNYREGLVIHKVSYNDSGTIRPLFYRLSTADLVVYYGDPRSPLHRRVVFDESQYGMGFNANSLNAGKDCVGEVKFIDGIFNTFKGEPKKVPRVVCIREEDNGLLWSHSESRTGRSSKVRSQRLSLTFIATVGNYDYIYTWSFYQDGKIELNVKLTGIPLGQMLALNATPAGYGTIVAPQINCGHHQHFITVRADPEIDGNKNTVSLSDVLKSPEPTGSPKNPYGNGFTTRTTVLRTASEGRTNTDFQKSRNWLISNPSKIHSYTKNPVSWQLKPFASAPLLIEKNSPLHAAVSWLDYETWVTPYEEGQLYPGGNYVDTGTGLTEWVERNPTANTEDTDVVLWHNIGISHIVRAEDWPVMPEETMSMFLKPYNFFKRNPALDVPGPKYNGDHTEL